MNERLAWAQCILASVAIVSIITIIGTSSNKAQSIIRSIEESLEKAENK